MSHLNSRLCSYRMGRRIVGVVVIALVAILIAYVSDDSESYLADSYTMPLSWPLFYAIHGAALFFQALSNALKPPPMRLVEDAHYFMVSRILYAVTELNLATLLGERHVSVEELAMQASVQSPEHLQRLLQAAQSMGYFQQDGQGHWYNNRLSSLLRDEHPTQLKYMVQAVPGFMYSMWDELITAVRVATPQDREALNQKLFDSPHKHAFWSHLAAVPDTQYIFQKFMVAMDSVSLMSTVLDYDWSQYNRVVDIGGQEGSFVKQLLLSYPTTLHHGVLFDLPHVIENAKHTWQAWPELEKKIEFISGDFFQVSTLPTAQSGDAFVMRNILHDWSDEHSLEILTNLRTVIGDATLLIVELVPEATDPFIGARLIDMHMMLIFGGKERSSKDWRVLFKQTGFELIRVEQTRSPLRVIEARPV